MLLQHCGGHRLSDCGTGHLSEGDGCANDAEDRYGRVCSMKKKGRLFLNFTVKFSQLKVLSDDVWKEIIITRQMVPQKPRTTRQAAAGAGAKCRGFSLSMRYLKLFTFVSLQNVMTRIRVRQVRLVSSRCLSSIVYKNRFFLGPPVRSLKTVWLMLNL